MGRNVFNYIGYDDRGLGAVDRYCGFGICGYQGFKPQPISGLEDIYGHGHHVGIRGSDFNYCDFDYVPTFWQDLK